MWRGVAANPTTPCVLALAWLIVHIIKKLEAHTATRILHHCQMLCLCQPLSLRQLHSALQRRRDGARDQQWRHVCHAAG